MVRDVMKTSQGHVTLCVEEADAVGELNIFDETGRLATTVDEETYKDAKYAEFETILELLSWIQVPVIGTSKLSDVVDSINKDNPDRPIGITDGNCAIRVQKILDALYGIGSTLVFDTTVVIIHQDE